MQAKFLRVLEMQQFTKLGDTKPTRVNVRLVAATNRNLKLEAAEGRFRPDLYYRLSVFTILVPSLKDRPADVPPLAQHFLQYFAAKLSKRLPDLEPECLQLLQAYPWPGNVRELKNVLERAAILAPAGEMLSADYLPDEFHALGRPVKPGADAADDSLRALEARHIGKLMGELDGNRPEVAKPGHWANHAVPKIVRVRPGVETHTCVSSLFEPHPCIVVQRGVAKGRVATFQRAICRCKQLETRAYFAVSSSRSWQRAASS